MYSTIIQKIASLKCTSIALGCNHRSHESVYTKPFPQHRIIDKCDDDCAR